MKSPEIGEIWVGVRHPKTKIRIAGISKKSDKYNIDWSFVKDYQTLMGVTENWSVAIRIFHKDYKIMAPVLAALLNEN